MKIKNKKEKELVHPLALAGIFLIWGTLAVLVVCFLAVDDNVGLNIANPIFNIYLYGVLKPLGQLLTVSVIASGLALVLLGIRKKPL